MGTVRYTTVNGEIIAEKRNGVRSLYVPDPLGSTVALLDNTQTKTDTFEYWPYGEVRTLTGTTATPFQFVGTLGYHQDGSGRTYVRARTLNTSQGRWMTQDPIGFDGGDWNLYRYVSNVPNSLVDASGKRPRPGLPCPPEVIAARKMVCDALRNATLASLKGCVTGPKHLQCLKDWCNKGRIYCVKATINECVGGCGFSYGGGDPGGRQDPDETVYICLPRGSRCNRRICKNGLAQTILHEINGNCGVNHNPTGPWEDACSGSAACQCPKLGI